VYTWKKENFFAEFWADNLSLHMSCDLFEYVRGKYGFWDVWYKGVDWIKWLKMWLTAPLDNHSNKNSFVMQRVYLLIISQELKSSLNKS